MLGEEPSTFSLRFSKVERVRVELESAEYQALAQLAERELRQVPSQLRHLLREELKRTGLLDDGDEPVQPRTGDAA